MKPLILELSAFCSYSDKTIIDFTRLGDNGIYLICGDTGAGKTTIFDAISYALYGKPSGDNRENDMLRSKYAKDTTPTYVKLNFSHNNKIYEVIRNPEYSRKKTRGEGLTKETSNATLILPDGRIISKYTDVTNSIIEILGIDREQFVKISMIAQGDFLKLLFADTKERGEIFSKIFNTYLYGTLQEKIKEAYKLSLDKYTKLTVDIKRELYNLTAKEGSPNLESLSTLKASAELNEFSRSEEIILAILDEDRVSQKLFLAEKEALEKAKEELLTLYTVLKKDIAIKNEISEKELYISKSKNDLEMLNNEYKKALELEPKKEEIVEKIALINNSLPKFIELDQENQKNSKLTKAIDSLNKTKESLKDNIEKNENDLTNAKKELLAFENIEGIIGDERLKYMSYENREKEISEIEAILSKYINLVTLRKSELEIYNTNKEGFQKINEEYTNAEIAFFDEQAGIIAQRLIKNEPCPVCGSIDHPKVAIVSKNAPTKASLDKLKGELEKIRAKTQDSGLKANETKAQALATLAQLKEKSQIALKTDNYEKIKSDIIVAKEENNNNLINSKKILDESKKRLAIKNSLNEKIPKLEAYLNENKKKYENEANTLTRLIAEKKASIERLLDIGKNLEFSSKSEALSKINKLKNEKDGIEANIKTTKERYDTLANNIEKTSSAIDTLKNQLSDKTEDINAVIANQDVNNKKLAKIGEQIDALNIRLKTNESIYNKTSAFIGRLSSVEKELADRKSLSAIVNGTTGVDKRLMLETYVQTAYLDKITRRANTRLMTMTGGQYELIRRTEGYNKRTKAGLELNIVDHYNGTLRSVKTLSGGEAFKASLCLALGLADEIQSYFGGIKIDSIFVDEGFGSLDESSLEAAIRELNRLSMGNRMVGIISHVAELKERIDKKIIVTKDKNGVSLIKIEV